MCWKGLHKEGLFSIVHKKDIELKKLEIYFYFYILLYYNSNTRQTNPSEKTYPIINSLYRLTIDESQELETFNFKENCTW